MKNKKMQKLGKAGAEKRWATRFEILTALSGKVDKEIHNKFMKWPTKYLVELLKAYKNHEKI
mgnify:CR=1 FL=1